MLLFLRGFGGGVGTCDSAILGNILGGETGRFRRFFRNGTVSARPVFLTYYGVVRVRNIFTRNSAQPSFPLLLVLRQTVYSCVRGGCVVVGRAF
jgi:hypothetical protein